MSAAPSIIKDKPAFLSVAYSVEDAKNAALTAIITYCFNVWAAPPEPGCTKCIHEFGRL